MVFLVVITCVGAAVGDLHEVLSTRLHEEREAAQALRHYSRDRVAIIGYSNIANYWVHLAEISISAEVIRENFPACWQAPPTKSPESLMHPQWSAYVCPATLNP